MLTPFPPSPPGQDHLAGRGPAPPLRTPGGGVTGWAQGRGGVCAQALRPPCPSAGRPGVDAEGGSRSHVGRAAGPWAPKPRAAGQS